MPDKIYIYGDSLLKATVPDGDFHYHFTSMKSCSATRPSWWRW